MSATARALARMGALVVCGGQLGGRRLLGAEALEAMQAETKDVFEKKNN